MRVDFQLFKTKSKNKDTYFLMWIERASLWSPPGRKSQEWTKENMSLTCSEGSLKVTIGENTLGWERFDLRKGLTWTTPEE